MSETRKRNRLVAGLADPYEQLRQTGALLIRTTGGATLARYEPNAKQLYAHTCDADEIMYGGAMWGGKSYWICWHNALHCMKWGKDANTVLFRRTYDELKGSLVGEYLRLFHGKLGTYKDSDCVFDWDNGAKTWFRHLERAADVMKHQSREYTLIGFDELTHFEESQYIFLHSRLRSSRNKNIHCQIISGTNPRGVGHHWVMDRFLRDKEPFTRYEYRIENPLKPGEKVSYSRCFIPARLEDNTVGLKNDPLYQARLKMNLPPDEYKAYVEGDWTRFEDLAFPEYAEQTHLVNDFPIPEDWKVIRALDWGYSAPFSVGWYAQNPDDKRVYRIAEWYGAKAGAEGGIHGVRMDVEEVRTGIMDREAVWVLSKMMPQPRYGQADPACWSRSGNGAGIADILNRGSTLFRPAERDRLVGKQVIHNLLRLSPETGKPGLQVFRSCKAFARTFPRLLSVPLGEKNQEDVDTTQEDHLYDEMRYALVNLVQSKPTRPQAYTETLRDMNRQPQLV